tara:strand:- start:165 stop:353 length:189 start_codon:yes stop_codon:yes gene_type:complete
MKIKKALSSSLLKKKEVIKNNNLIVHQYNLAEQLLEKYKPSNGLKDYQINIKRKASKGVVDQ